MLDQSSGQPLLKVGLKKNMKFFKVAWWRVLTIYFERSWGRSRSRFFFVGSRYLTTRLSKKEINKKNFRYCELENSWVTFDIWQNVFRREPERVTTTITSEFRHFRCCSLFFRPHLSFDCPHDCCLVIVFQHSLQTGCSTMDLLTG